MPTPEDFLANWFDLLEKMQDAAKEIDLDTAADLADFSKQKISDLLSTAAAKDQFKQKLDGFLRIGDADLSNASTFLDLLNAAYNHLSSYVLGVFQFVAGDATSSPLDFGNKLTA